MKDMVKSKTLIGFVLFILGVSYISTPALSYDEKEVELSNREIDNSVYNV